MIVTKPPMGWNSWNTFGRELSEDMIKETADSLVSTGLKDLGYQYVVIDDCWSLLQRDSHGRLVPDGAKFPHGMKYIADYVHSLGLKFGMYSCAGYVTCASFPGSFDYEMQDARTFASWGVDLLKYDFCYVPATVSPQLLFQRMGTALANCQRKILFSVCTGGRGNVGDWVSQCGGHMWRTTRDIEDSWQNLKELVKMADNAFGKGGINCFPDMDMLIVGMRGRGNVGLTGCTDEEYKLHMSMWALCGSPLMIGCDIRNMDEATKAILSNKEVLKIDQDASFRVPINLSTEGLDSDHRVYARLLDNGDYAIAQMNLADDKSWGCCTQLNMDRLGLGRITGKTLQMKEVWTGEEVTVRDGIFMQELEPHTCKLYRAKIVNI